jgi:hypothetical protein
MCDGRQEKEEKLKSMSDAVKVVIDNYPAGHEFYGNELKDDVVKIYPDAINMYPDTILKMARRHRRESYIAIDHNNSLYQKVAVKSIIELIKEAAPKERPQSVPAQGFLFVLAVFFVLGFEAVFTFESTFGRPLTEPFMASKSASLYTPAEPINVYGRLPNRWSLLFTASDDIPNAWDIYSTVIGDFSIYSSLTYISSIDQALKVKMSKHFDILLYRCIAKTRKICKFLKISSPTLDCPLGRGYYLIYKCPNTWTLKKRLPEAPEAERRPIGVAEGELYERRTEKFSGMA